MACTRKEILSAIRSVIEDDVVIDAEAQEEVANSFEYILAGGKINVLDLLSVFTTARDNLLSELMDKLAKDDVSKDDVIDVIGGIMMGFNQ